VTAILCRTGGKEVRHEAANFINTFPVNEFIHCLSPAPPPAVLEAADGLR